MLNPSYDIFCKLVDNYGDIGVCWRLAKQLYDEHDIEVQLYVDNLTAAKQLIPKLDDGKKTQVIDGISINRFDINTEFQEIAGVVIEAFACGLPKHYQESMQATSIWVNLEYLSAEPWVADFHAKHSKFSHTNFVRHFFFPGFQAQTGGLLREQDLIVSRDAFAKEHQKLSFLNKFDIVDDDSLKVSLFSYQHASIGALFDDIANGTHQVTVFAPMNPHLQTCAPFLNKASFEVGERLFKGKLILQILPFMSQIEYDQLLWFCDVNFVRGEDSWVRAIWSGKPFIWQPYVQVENVHLNKLNAFIDFYYDQFDDKSVVSDMHSAWSNGNSNASCWEAYIESLTRVKHWCTKQSEQLAEQNPLATQLVTFCGNITS